MLRRSLLAVPALVAGAALVGAVYGQRPALVAILAGLVALAVEAALAAVAERRAGTVADRVQRIAGGDTAIPIEVVGSREWQRLLSGLNQVGSSLERRFAELQDERVRIERLLDDLPTAVLLFSVDRLAYANPVARTLFGVSRSADRTPLQVLGTEGLADAVTEARETGSTVEVEVERDDRELVGRASVTAAGEVAMVVTDLTEVRRVHQIRRDFVTNASHELKTPVAGMLALSDSLRHAFDRDPDRARTMVSRVQLEAERLGQLVRDLLDLARLEERGEHEGRHRVDVAEVVRVQADRLGPLAAQRGVTIRCDCSDPAPAISLPQDLRLIATNLIENAVRYNRPGGAVLATVRRNGTRIHIDVADNGVGIPEAERGRVFERFYRVDKGRSRLAGGTGLGLSIVRHAVERHGGTITLDSVLGEGTTVRVVLPVEGEAGVS
ncbi:ATP-binding protein [soil metagenome]